MSVALVFDNQNVIGYTDCLSPVMGWLIARKQIKALKARINGVEYSLDIHLPRPDVARRNSGRKGFQDIAHSGFLSLEMQAPEVADPALPLTLQYEVEYADGSYQTSGATTLTEAEILSLRAGGINYLLANGYEQDARTFLEQYIARFPDELRFYVMQINILLREGKLKDARCACEYALERFKDTPLSERQPLVKLMGDVILGENDNPEVALEYYMNLYQKDGQWLHVPAFMNGIYELFVPLVNQIAASGKDVSAFKGLDFLMLMNLLDKNRQDAGGIYNIFHFSKRQLPGRQVDEAFFRAARQCNPDNIYVRLLLAETPVEEKADILQFLLEGGHRAILYFMALAVNNRPAYEIMIRRIMERGAHERYSEEIFFNFARIVNFFNQSLADELLQKNETRLVGKPLSSPGGLLWHRLQKRRELEAKIPDAGPRRKLRVALCISGQLRSYEDCYPRILRKFDFQNHDLTVFIHAWKHIGRKFPNLLHAHRTFGGHFLNAWKEIIFNKDPVAYMKAEFPSLYKLLMGDSTADYEHVCAFYKTRNVIMADDNIGFTANWDNIQKLYFNMYLCNRMVPVKDFDLVIRMRHDTWFKTTDQLDLYDLYQLSANRKALWVSEALHQFGASLSGYSLGDIIAIGLPELMRIYCGVFPDMPAYFWKNNAYGCKRPYSDHRSLEYQLYANGVRVEQLNNTGYMLRDPSAIKTERIYEALIDDVKAREPTAADLRLLEACKQDLGLQ